MPRDYMWDYRNPYEWMERTLKSKLPPLIISCAVTGGIHGKEVNENLPETAEEQADQVYDAWRITWCNTHRGVICPQGLRDGVINAEILMFAIENGYGGHNGRSI